MALPRELWQLWLCLLFFCLCFINAALVDIDKCDELRLGQYICDSPKINDVTQEPENCTNETAFVPCMPAPNITCKNYSGFVNTFSGKEVGFYKPFSCRNVSGYSYKVAVALSLFLGWLGADRFYLGYPALGLLKFCTVGFCGIGSLIDFVLISAQHVLRSCEMHLNYGRKIYSEQRQVSTDFMINKKIVGPSDGSSYIIDYYGARLTRLTIDNDTYRKTQMKQ